MSIVFTSNNCGRRTTDGQQRTLCNHNNSTCHYVTLWAKKRLSDVYQITLAIIMLLLNNTESTYNMLISFIDTSYIMCYHKLFISISCFCSGCWAVSKCFNNSFTSMINKQQKIILPSIAHHAISWSIAQPGLGFSRAVNTLPTLVYIYNTVTHQCKHFIKY